MSRARDSGGVVVPRPSNLTLSIISLAVFLIAASSFPTQPDTTEDQLQVERAAYARLYFFFQDIADEGRRIGLYRRVARDFRTHIEKYPDGETVPHARYYLGECHWVLGQKEEAIRLWEGVTESPNESLATKADIRLADHFLAEKEYKKALPHFRVGADLAVGEEEKRRCRLHVGVCHYFIGEKGKAKEILAKFVAEVTGGILHDTAERYLDRLDAGRGEHTARKAVQQYRQDYGEYRVLKEGNRKSLVAELIRENLQTWDGIDHKNILKLLRSIVATRKHPFAADAIRELAQIGTPEAVGPLLRKLQDRNDFQRTAILSALVAGRVFINDEFVEKIFEDRTVRTPGLRGAAADYIAMRDTAEAVVKLLAGIVIPETGKEPRSDLLLNERIRKALARMRSKEAAKALGRVARDTSQPSLYREFALEALSHMAHPETLKDLITLLRDGRIEILSLAVRALGQTGEPRARDALLKLLRKKPKNPRLLTSLLSGLDQLGVTEKHEKLFVSLSKSGNVDVRILAHSLLRQSGGRAAQRRLRVALDDKLWQVRWQAVRALGQGEPSVDSITALIGRLPREKGRLGPQILKYLIRMTGVNLGPEHDEWKRWWEWARETYDPNKVDLATQALGGGEKKTVSRAIANNEYFGLKIDSDRVIFILDVSGSMQVLITVPPLGGEATKPRTDSKINIARSELIRVLTKFPKTTSFNIYWFSTGWSSLWKSLRPAVRDNVSHARREINKIPAVGGTNIYDPLAVAVLDPNVDTIYLLSDGEPNGGQFTYPEDIVREIAQLNYTRMVKINTIFLGGTSDFMKELAEKNGGQYVPVAG
ncbi:MAG: HEAT repeat domain-containing protein [Planctomycetota bacterium]|nr:HEAT repeat domain-containing protein [Planctomycetota bacterium]